jgi:aspartate/methionine/tyrosine aminotransferase
LADSNPTNHQLLPPQVLDAVARAAHLAGRYSPHPRGALPAREALAASFGGSPDDYWLTASTSEAYSWLFQLLADPGGRIGLPTPGYPLIEPLAALAGLGTAPYRTFYVHPSGWEFDLESFDRAAAWAKAMIVVNPNNPTGQYLDAAGPAVDELCARHGVPLIADEVFWPFALERDQPPAPSAEPAPNHSPQATVFHLSGLSKLLAAPQLKLAWIRLAGPDAGQYEAALDQLADTFLSANGVVQAALPELLALMPQTVDDINRRLAANLRTARALPDGFRVRRCDGGWTLLVDAPPVSDDLALDMLERAHLITHPAWFYDLDAPNTVALSLLPEPARFKEQLDRFAQAVMDMSGD